MEPWEDIILDVSEIQCRMSEQESNRLLEALRRQGISADHVSTHTAFSLDHHLVVVLKDGEPKHGWFYYPKSGKILKRKIG